MRIAGHTLDAIAAALGYTSAREVSAVIKNRIDEKKKSIAHSVDQAFAVEYERLEAQRRAVWPRVMQWERTHPRTGAPIMQEDGTPDLYPFDYKAHQLSLQLHDRVVKLFGLEKVKIEISGPGGGPVQIEGAPADLAKLTPQEMALLEHLHAKARGLPSPLDPGGAGEGGSADVVESADVVDVETE